MNIKNIRIAIPMHILRPTRNLFGNLRILPVLLIIVITLFSSSIPISTLGQSISNGSFKTYTDFNRGFTIKYPSGWIVQSNFNAPLNLVASKCCAEISFFSYPKGSFPSNVTVDNLGRLYHRISAPNPFYMEISYTGPSHSNERIAGYSAYKSISTAQLGGSLFKSMEIGTIIGNRIYIIAYRAANDTYDSFLGPAQNIINSFQLINH